MLVDQIKHQNIYSTNTIHNLTTYSKSNGKEIVQGFMKDEMWESANTLFNLETIWQIN